MTTGTMYWEIPDDVIKRMSDEELARVVRRSDAPLPQLRKRIRDELHAFGPETQKAAAEWEPWTPPPSEMEQVKAKLDAIEKSLEALGKRRGLFF